MKAFKKRYKSSRPAPPPPARRRWGPLIVAAAVLLIAAGGLLVWGQSSREPGMPIEVKGAPRVAVAQDSVDHGDLKFDTTVSSIFQVSNVGDKPLQILGEPQVELVEGCWPPRAVVSSTTIKPGGQASITLDYMMHEGMGGQHEFRVYLRTNDPAEPEKILIARSNWVP